MAKSDVLCKYGNFGDPRDNEKQRQLAEVFSRRSIYFARAADLNDPFELKPRFNVTDTPEEQLVDWLAKVAMERNVKLRASEAITFAQGYLKKNPDKFRDEKIDEQLTQNLQRDLSANVGILCLSKVPDNILMFSHYGAAHTGYCLEFEGQSLKKHFSAAPPMEMNYVLEYPIVNPLHKVSMDMAMVLWGAKFRDWEYEQEARFISDTSISIGDGKAGGPGLKIYPKGALKAVAFGASTSAENMERVRTWLSLRDDGPIDLIQTKPHPKEFRLVRHHVGTV